MTNCLQKMNGRQKPNQCIIDLAAIKTNLYLIKNKLPKNTRVMAIVKAGAYGTGQLRMAAFLESCGIDILGVANVDEGIDLAKGNIARSVFVIHAAPHEAADIVEYGLEVGVSDEKLVQALNLEALRQKKRVKVHLHVDTGMGRLGCRTENALPLSRLIAKSPLLDFAGVMTHFPCADDPGQDEFTMEQVVLFDKVIAEMQREGIDVPWKHAANSAASIRFNLPQYNMVRLGIALYGFHTSASANPSLELHPAISLCSRITSINLAKRGETISYGRTYRVQKETQRIAVLPIGYFDGLHRHYSEKGSVLIRGKKAPMVGTICMDFMMLDVTDIQEADVGDLAVLFGQYGSGCYLPPEYLAAKGGSVVHELVACLGPRVERVFVRGDLSLNPTAHGVWNEQSD